MEKLLKNVYRKNIPTPPIVPAKPSTPSVVQLEQPIPEFDTKEEAEKAFLGLLKETVSSICLHTFYLNTNHYVILGC